LPRDLGDSERSADLVGGLAACKNSGNVGERAVDDEPGFLDSEPRRGGRIDSLRHGVARRSLAGDAEHAETLLIAKSVLHRPHLRCSLQLDDAVTAPDSEPQLLARTGTDDPLHVRKTVDPAAVDRCDDVSDLETGGRGRTARLDLVNPRRGAWL